MFVPPVGRHISISHCKLCYLTRYLRSAEACEKLDGPNWLRLPYWLLSCKYMWIVVLFWNTVCNVGLHGVFRLTYAHLPLCSRTLQLTAVLLCLWEVENLAVFAKMMCSSLFYTDVQMYRTVSFCVLCECETWSLKRISLAEVRKQGESDKAGENCTVKSSMIFSFYKM
jgi:hypothetical protein